MRVYLTYRLLVVQFMPGLAKALAAEVAARQRSARVFSDSPLGLGAKVASAAVVVVAHRQQPFRTDLPTLPQLLRAC
jgi:hypothetical protein